MIEPHFRNFRNGCMRGSRGGVGGVRTPPGICKYNIADITGNKKISYFTYLFTSTVIHQTESIHKITIKKNSIQVCVMGFFLIKVGPPLEKFSGSAPGMSTHRDWLRSFRSFSMNWITPRGNRKQRWQKRREY